MGVAAEGLDRSWLGRELDEKARQDLIALSEKTGVSLCGEGGEFESLVIDGPNFQKKLEIMESTVEWKGSSGVLRILQAVVSLK